MKLFLAKNKKKSLIIIIIVFIVTTFVLYFSSYYHNTDQSAFDSNAYVNIEEYDDYYFIDGKGEKNALIFYQGAKVEESAYLKLLKSIAENGVDCFLVKMPLKFAMFDINRANEIINKYNYSFYVGGHSFGGLCSCMYAEKNANKIDGIVILGGYSNTDLSNYNIRVLSVFGSNDAILHKNTYQDSISYMPKYFVEEIIDGGNHSYFGTYGLQKNDKEAQISNQEQIELTSKTIVSFINN